MSYWSPFSGQGSNLGLYIAFNCHLPLIWIASQSLPFTSSHWKFWRILVRCSINILQIGFVWHFFLIKSVLMHFGKSITQMMLHSSQCIISKVSWCQYVLLLVMLTSVTVYQVVVAGFPHCKITFFLLVMKKCLVGRFFWDSVNILLLNTFLPATRITLPFVEVVLYFHHSFHIY